MKKSILIVDDNEDDIMFMKYALAKSGRQVQIMTALNGETALDLLLSGQNMPALILLDLKMPGIGGMETLREIRADARLNAIPVVIVTSSSLKADEDNARAVGADFYLQKALGLHQFTEDIKSVLGRWLPD